MRKIVEKSIAGQAWAMRDDNKNDDIVLKILESRGIVGAVEIQRFLNPTIKEYMPNPSVMTDMDKAARIITDALMANKKIAIYGDYDVDGITATAVFVKYLRAVGADVIWHVPTRDGEGYGLNKIAIDEIITAGADLLITVDCGISGAPEVAYAKSRDLTVIITDHHSPDVQLPIADAIVNPKRADDTSGLSYLAGVGVAFIVLVALNRELKKTKTINFDLMSLMDFVALGTICDTMPLVGLNRAFAATGLKVLSSRNNVGLRALMDAAGIKKPNAYSVMFGIGPRLNAAGRLGSANPVLELLLTDNILIANDLSAKLNAMNTERIGVQNAIMIDAIEIAKQKCSAGNHSLFVCGDNWHKGVIGIIAGRIKDKFNLPTCVAVRDCGAIDGSGRAPAGVDLGKIIHDAIGLGILTAGGGHAAAAGFSLDVSRENEFAEFMEKSVREQLNGKLPENQIVIDAEMDAGGANMDLVHQLEKIEPFGQNNPEPILVLNGATLMFASVMGNGEHLRGSVRTSNGGQLAFVGFNLVRGAVGNFLLDDANINTKIKLCGKLKENEFNGRISVQFVLEDIAM